MVLRHSSAALDPDVFPLLFIVMMLGAISS